MDMRITGAYSAYTTYPVKNTPAPQKARGQAGTDSVSISAAASDYQLARRAVADLPDVRANHVAHLRAQIEAGTYQVDTASIAAKILRG